MLRTPVFIAILFVYAILLAACGTQEKKPSQDVLLAKNAFGQMERLRQAYSARDMAALEALCSEEAYASLKMGMREFRSVKLEFEYKWVDIKTDGTIEVQVAWTGKWTLQGDDAVVSDRGWADFLLSGSKTKLISIKGSSPFAGPSGTGMP